MKKKVILARYKCFCYKNSKTKMIWVFSAMKRQMLLSEQHEYCIA